MTAAWAIMALWMSASLSPDLMLGLAVLGIGGLLGLIWTFQVLRVVLDREARGRLTPRAIVAWAICPATGLLLVALVGTQWPVALRVKLSEPALLRLVEDVEARRATVPGTFGVGRVSVEEATVAGNCVILYTGSGFFIDYGLAFSRDGNPPAPEYMRSFRHLFGRWYTYSLSF